MAPIALTSVISCSSEDKVSCAANLLKSDSFRKWSTDKPGLNKASVILQLEREEQITQIDIGNNGSAFIEILVSCSATDCDQFENLVVSSVFMSPTESKTDSNRYKIRFFSKDSLCNPAAGKKWDRIKIVCSQPFNKHIKYGISMITVHGPRKPIKIIPSIQTPVVEASTSNETTEIVNEEPRTPSTPSNEEGRAASALLANLTSSSSTDAMERLRNSDNKHHFAKPPSGLTTARPSVIDLNSDEDSSTHSPKRPKTPSRITKASSLSNPETPNRVEFKEILKDVVMVLSGFQNPLRSDIRETGLSMGAQYRPDWTSDSTHLICAVANTPKYNQVKGKGVIVSKEWLFDCRNKRRRIPDTKYRMDQDRKRHKVSQRQDSSEDEDETTNKKKRRILESSDEDFIPSSPDSSQLSDEVSGDISDDQTDKDGTEIGKQLIDLADESSPTKTVHEISDSDSEGDVYEALTDEETEEQVIERLRLPRLPSFFTGHRFFLHSESFPEFETIKEVTRCLITYGGMVFDHMSRDVRFIVTNSEEWQSDFETALSVNPEAKFLRTKWVDTCCEKRKAVDKEPFYLLS